MGGVANRIYQLHSGILFLLPAATKSATQVGYRGKVWGVPCDAMAAHTSFRTGGQAMPL